MRLRKFAAVAMTVVTMMSCFTGCGSKETANETPNYEGSTLNIHFHSNNKYTLADADGNLLPVFQLAADETKINVNSVANPVATNSLQEFELQATEQFPADIYGGTSIRQSVNSYGVQGAFLPLDELIEKYAPNIKKYLAENPDVKKSLTAADGHIYFLAYAPDGDVGRTYFMRTDWLKNLGLSMPKTFQELENILYAFKNNDPNQNGQKDEVPVFNDKWQEAVRLANLWGARVYGSDSFSERVVLDDKDKMYHAWTAKEFKTALVGLNKWYKDGIIDPEVFSRKANTAKQTLWTKSNVGGMTHDFFASTSAYNYNQELLSSVPNFKLEAFLPVNANGAAFEEHQRVIAKNDGWAISAKTSNAAAAIAYMDWFYSEEGKTASNFGIEGKSYTMVDGKPTFTAETLGETNVNTYLQKTFGAQLPIGYAQNFDYEEQWTSKEGLDAFNMYKKDAKYVKATPVLSFSESEQEVYDTYAANLNTYQDEMVTGFITGKFDVNSEWDAYVQKCKDLGSEKLVEIYQSAYERYKNVK
ncbi:MAG: extracellular solute-binding protein [Eubacteriales bacterium]|nr:extracellular solute-binding protein [Eubacteriales bacterium]